VSSLTVIITLAFPAKASFAGVRVRSFLTPSIKEILCFSSLYPSVVCSCNVGPNTYIAKIDSEIAYNIIYKREQLDKEQKIKIIQNPIKGSSSEKEIKLGNLIDQMDKNKWILTYAGTIFKNHKDELSILNKIFTYLLDSRKTYKKIRDDYKKNNNEEMMKKYDSLLPLRLQYAPQKAGRSRRKRL
jgi:DNA polymerase elongation subunit (family B)